MAPRSFVWLDVFTDQPFRGNALAVFPDADGLSDAQMRSIARELNLSETTFVTPPEIEGTTHRVRIFTATRELPFAGHPTVGTAIALAEASGEDEVHLVLGLTAGPTPVHVTRDAHGVRQAAFVSPQVPRLGPAPASLGDVAQLVGLADHDLDPTIPVHLTDSGGTVFLVVAVRSLDALARCRPVGVGPDVVGIYVVCPVDGAWRCRMFAPEAGVVEDPATGSAGCSFAGTLHRFVPGYGADGTHVVEIRQGVEMGRASQLWLSFDVSAGQISEVRMRGAAVPVLRGQVDVAGL
jgi:trans-2,3-dihydro-3-hydroxyanthranilate isomerase